MNFAERILKCFIHQEIPFQHVWKPSSNLLHCSFTLERNNGDVAPVSFTLRARQVDITTGATISQQVTINVNTDGSLQVIDQSMLKIQLSDINTDIFTDSMQPKRSSARGACVDSQFQQRVQFTCHPGTCWSCI
jgi:hypothetical protein